MKQKLTPEDYVAAARALGWQAAAVHAVCEIEAPGGGFEDDDEVTGLFERHKFSQHTGGKYDTKYPDISNPVAGGYGKSSEQHPKLQRAAKLDRDSALKSFSWGKFQILGENFKQAGFDTLQAFINAMVESERTQLKAFIAFIRADHRLLEAGRTGDWATFARWYNGKNYRKFKYDIRLAAAAKKWGWAA